MARRRGLTAADEKLWAAYSQTVTLLPGRARLPVAPAPAEAAQTPRAPAPAPAAPPARQPPVHIGQPPAGLDKASWQKFASGRLRAAQRLDLHGLTATRAHRASLAFIQRAHAEQTRCIEIITGKGDVLARELPHWLNAPALRPLILAIAHPHRANTGSVRLLLRRLR